MNRRFALPRLIATGLRALALAVPVIAAGAATATATATAPTVPGSPALTSGHGITVISQHRLDSRLIALSVSTDALTGPANIRILLPAGYASSPRRHYPVLYLLHGTSGGASDWTTMGDAEQTTAGRPLIVVMPDIAQNDNGGGWCTNWYNAGSYGRPQWERFNIDQLIPWVDRNLRTVAARRGRAIAGLSQGGFCAMSYAARHPDLFEAALSFSGAPDIAFDAKAQALVTPIINATETGLDQVPPNSIFGPRQTEEINWAEHDPATLAANLRHTGLTIYTGNGQPGPLDPAVPNPGAMVIESGVEQLTTLFHARLQSLGIPSRFDDYGPGTHSFPYWARDLRWAMGPIMAGFAHPPATPRSVAYTSAEPAYGVYGWQVSTHRKVQEFSTLSSAGPAGFVLEGSGSATVLTPARYRRHARYRIRIAAHGSNTARIVTAGLGRRLEIQVPLGPSDTVQEFPGDGPSLGTTVSSTQVSISPASRAPRNATAARRRGSG